MLVAATLIAGCLDSTDSKFVGTWTAPGIDAACEVTFNRDHTGRARCRATDWDGGIQTFRWSVEGNQLFEWFDDGKARRATIVAITPTDVTLRYSDQDWPAGLTRPDPAERRILMGGIILSAVLAGAFLRSTVTLIGAAIVIQLVAALVIYYLPFLRSHAPIGEFELWQLRALSMLGVRPFLRYRRRLFCISPTTRHTLLH